MLTSPFVSPLHQRPSKFSTTTNTPFLIGVVNLVTRSKNTPTGREVGVSTAGDGTARARARITQHWGTNAGVWTSLAGGQSAGRDFFFKEYVADGPPEVAGNARGVDGARFATLTGRVWWNDFTLAWSFHLDGVLAEPDIPRRSPSELAQMLAHALSLEGPLRPSPLAGRFPVLSSYFNFLSRFSRL